MSCVGKNCSLGKYDAEWAKHLEFVPELKELNAKDLAKAKSRYIKEYIRLNEEGGGRRSRLAEENNW